MLHQAGKYIIIIAVVLLIIGLILFFFGNKMHWLFNLPGDIKIEKKNFRFYFPLVTMFILSILRVKEPKV
ncbi:MAG: DUF2905 domain-containing protein [Bacteroidia bacterium]|nr:DUF2905 domain-containing protein [Bacteroidia bacterium]